MRVVYSRCLKGDRGWVEELVCIFCCVFQNSSRGSFTEFWGFFGFCCCCDSGGSFRLLCYVLLL